MLAGAYQSPDRHRAIGVWAAVGGLGLPAGPLVGGLLVQAWGWRAVFWLNVPVVAAALVAVGQVVPDDHGRDARPAFAMLVLVPPVAGRLVARYGVRVVLVCGLMASAAGVGMLTVSTGTSSAVGLLPALVVWGAGLGLLAPAVVSGAVGSVPEERSGLAGAVNNAARQAGNAVGVPACAAVAGPVGGSFVAGVHVAAASAAVLLCAAAAVAGRLFPAHRRA